MTIRIVWKEGMALSPHHFQQADGFALGQVRDLAGLSRGRNFGFQKLAFSSTAMAAGMVALDACEVIFPSGLGYSEGSLPGLQITARAFAPLFSADKMALAVFMGLPVMSGTRFQAVHQTCSDQVGDAEPMEIAVAAPVPRILFEGESQEGLEILPLALLKRNAQGVVELAPDFCPPLLSLDAYRLFSLQLERIKMAVAARIARVQAFKPSLSGNGIGQVLYLQVLQSFQAVFERMLSVPGVEPFHLFLEMARMVGSVQVFRNDTVSPPHYDHLLFGASFDAMFKAVGKQLEIEQSNAYSGRRMEREGQTAFVASVDGLGLGLGKNVYVAVESSLAPEELQRVFPVQAKVAPRSKLQGIIISAMQGIVCQPSSPPAGIQEAPDTHYFCLTTESALWTDLLQELRLGIYAPQTLQIRSIGILVENPQ